MSKIVPFSKNREVIYGLLKRARSYHCTCTSLHEFDVTELYEELAKLRASGVSITFNACLIKATSLVLKRFPRLNHHLFHGLLRKYEVEFDDITCNAVLLRKDGPEWILLPLLIPNTDQLTVREIDTILEHNQTAALEDLPSARGIQALKRMPVAALKAFSFLSRSNHRFYRKFFGTYGYSSLLLEGADGVAQGKVGVTTQQVANTCSVFQPTAVSDQPAVIDGEIVVRKMLSMTFSMDHYLIDGFDAAKAITYLSALLRRPHRLGLDRVAE